MGEQGSREGKDGGEGQQGREAGAIGGRGKVQGEDRSSREDTSGRRSTVHGNRYMGGPRLEEKWRNRTARNMDHRGQLLTLTMGERGKESDKEVEDDKTDSQKEDTTQRMIVHHPNLSKILEKRQAMRDSITNSP